MLQFDELRLELEGLRPEIDDLAEALGLERMRNEIAELDTKASMPGFWDDAQNSQKILQRSSSLKDKIAAYEKLTAAYDDTMALIELGNEEGDESLLPEAKDELKNIRESLETQRLSTLLNGEYDNKNAILTFHAGAGGTEAQDWAEMLYRMYCRWGERHNFKVSTLDYLDGEEAGLKSASILIEGENAYGFLKSESGVHRLVRVSPFDASGRRHTSFSSLEVMPEIDDTIEIEIDPADIKMDVYRASGAGGQKVNKTSSAVRLIHIPTGIVVQCQDQKSQLKNFDKAFEELRTRVFNLEYSKYLDEIASKRKTMVSTGDRSAKIRTYNYPQGRITDHRINYTIYNLSAFMDGDIQDVIDHLIVAENAERLKESEL